MVRLNPERPQVRSGEGVGVDVLIQNGDNVGQVNFQLRYNAEVLRFVPPGEPGDFLAQNGVIPDVQVVEGGEGGVIVVSLTRPGEQGANGGGRLLRLNFVALRPGTASFQFATAQVRDPDSNALPAGLRVVNVEVAP